MLKKIAVEKLEPGMFLHDICGSWLDHPFWRTRFMIRNAGQVEKLRASGLAECWIDLGRGTDVARKLAALSVPATDSKPDSSQAAPRSAPRAASSPKTSPVGDETEKAALLVLVAKNHVLKLFDDVRLGHDPDIRSCLPIVDEIAASIARNPSAMVGVVRLKSYDDYTFSHSVAVCTLMVSLAQQLALSDAQVREMGLAGLLHDVGKASVPAEILGKPGPLTDDEFDIVKRHSRLGHYILSATGDVSELVLEACLQHHERPDGKGYPNQVGGDDLKLHSRMTAICDVYDAVTSDRPYKRAWCPAEALVQMSQWAKAGQFDPAIFRAFIECVGVFPVGSLVRLHSDRLAVVIENIRGSVRAPRVRAFYSTRASLPIPLETIDLSTPGCSDSIVGRESNDKWGFPHLASLIYGEPDRLVAQPLARDARIAVSPEPLATTTQRFQA